MWRKWKEKKEEVFVGDLCEGKEKKRRKKCLWVILCEGKEGFAWIVDEIAICCSAFTQNITVTSKKKKLWLINNQSWTQISSKKSNKSCVFNMKINCHTVQNRTKIGSEDRYREIIHQRTIYQKFFVKKILGVSHSLVVAVLPFTNLLFQSPNNSYQKKYRNILKTPHIAIYKLVVPISNGSFHPPLGNAPF